MWGRVIISGRHPLRRDFIRLEFPLKIYRVSDFVIFLLLLLLTFIGGEKGEKKQIVAACSLPTNSRV